MSNLTNRPVYQKGQKRKRGNKLVIATTPFEALVERAKAKAPERVYLDWLIIQPSALDGALGNWNMDLGRWENEPAHFRTAQNSGVGAKPPYQAIPLTSEQHKLQHSIGTFDFRPREWWEENVSKYLQRWLDS